MASKPMAQGKASSADAGFEAGPSPASLVEGLRDFGYTLDTALADIVDNSISAKASRVDILARHADGGDSWIALLDNGSGMSRAQLRQAVRLASTNPTDLRSASDLGRFGLGLKTASFSQCRRVTVLTRQGGVLSSACWDLDEVVRRDRWFVSEPRAQDIPWSERLDHDGTLVVWERLDRVAGADSDQVTFARRLADATDHLELVFHRFLNRSGQHPPLVITMNNRPLKSFDPFATKHKATMAGPEDVFKTVYGKVVIQAFTLPHHSKMDRAAWDRLGGRDGFIKNQGFYVYRADRLIVWGTWFGLVKQSERTKLARVRIDLPNSMDEYWKINVLKASAEPPDAVRKRLKVLIETIVSSSKRIYTYRGVKQAEGAELPSWTRIQSKSGIRYEPDAAHPLIHDLLAEMPRALRSRVLRVLQLLGKTLPVDSLLHDLSDSPDLVNSEAVPRAELEIYVRDTAGSLLKRGHPWEKILRMMQSSPPFDVQWSETLEIVNEMRNDE